MPHISRRELLKGLAAAGAVSAFPIGLSKMVFGQSTNTPILVVIHLRGGCDGLNFVSPASDSTFINARSSDLRVGTDGKDAGYALANAPDAKIDFRLHPAAGGLNELYKQGYLAFIHACGLTDSTRSHFVATDMIEHGVGTEKDLARIENGWIARVFNGQTSGIAAVAANGGISGDLEGLQSALAVPNLGGGLSPIGGPQISSFIWSMYSGLNSPIGEAGRRALVLPTVIDKALPRDAQGHLLPYQPANSADYSAAGSLTNSLKTAAELIKMELGLRAVTIDYGNWDTHEYQAGRFHNLIEPLSNGINAFWNDISAYHERVVLVTLTEFGRRLRSNKSNGTDHGRAGLMAVMGAGVKGGHFYGRWPGLTSAQLDEGVDLAVTTDYRQVLSDVLNHVTGKSESAWFPNYKYAGTLGLF